MATASSSGEPASPRQTFAFYAADGRVYASNVDQKLIDLGALTRQDDGRFRYLLDGNKQCEHGLASAEAALRHIADHAGFLYLDGQFTALADLRERATQVHLDGAPRIEVTMDVLPSGEPIEDARA
jgi:hypothetical protein